MKLEELSTEAAKLPEDERASLAAQLLHGLEKPHYHVSDEEVLRRVSQADEDPGVMITFDQLVSGLQFRAHQRILNNYIAFNARMSKEDAKEIPSPRPRCCGSQDRLGGEVWVRG